MSQIKITAAEQKVSILRVNPAYTSQMCSCCGHISEDNRPGGCQIFKCVNCGFSLNSDHNAALNIKNIDTGVQIVPLPKIMRNMAILSGACPENESLYENI